MATEDKDMDETKQWISGCVAAVLLFTIFFGGAVSCAVKDMSNQTARRQSDNLRMVETVRAACGGDMNETARTAACIVSLTAASK